MHVKLLERFWRWFGVKALALVCAGTLLDLALERLGACVLSSMSGTLVIGALFSRSEWPECVACWFFLTGVASHVHDPDL